MSLEQEENKDLADAKCLCPHCGSEEFITKPNRYDIYKVEDGKIRFSHSELTNDEIKLYCRECSEELEYEDDDLEM